MWEDEVCEMFERDLHVLCILAGKWHHISCPAVHMCDATLNVEVIPPDTWLNVKGGRLFPESRAHMAACSYL